MMTVNQNYNQFLIKIMMAMMMMMVIMIMIIIIIITIVIFHMYIKRKLIYFVYMACISYHYKNRHFVIFLTMSKIMMELVM